MFSLIKFSKIPKIQWDKLFFTLIIKKSIPYAILIFLMSVYYYSDVIMVEKIRNNRLEKETLGGCLIKKVHQTVIISKDT